MSKEIFLSASGVSTYTQCSQKYSFKYNDRAYLQDSAPENSDLARGLGFHAGVDVIKQGLSDYIPAVRNETKYLSYAKAVLTEYMVTAWKNYYADDGLEYLQTEFSWQYNFSKNITLRGIFDGIVRTPSGELYVIEHKTTENKIGPADLYWKRLDINHQVDIYIMAANELGYDVQGVIYDVVRMPKLKLEKTTPVNKRERYKRNGANYSKGDYKPWVRLSDETHTEFELRAANYIADNVHDLLRREEVQRTEEELEKTRRDIKMAAKGIRADVYFRNPWACHMGAKHTCEYHPVCSSMGTLTDESLYQIKKYY